MEIKKKVDREAQLLEARREALDNAANHVLRPLGKLWGMDVFGWYNPSIGELAATLTAFPFPVYWLANEKTIQEMAHVDPQTLKSVNWVGQYDQAQMTIPSDVATDIPLITATETIEDSLIFMGQMKASKHILLFTYKGNEWKTNYETFVEFVKQNQ